MTGNTIYHVQFKSGGDHYFGSIAAIYETFKHDALAVSKQRLYDFGITTDHYYENKICVIKKETLKRKKGNRKLPKKVTVIIKSPMSSRHTNF